MISQQIDLNLATEFTTTPGPRKRSEGKFSGQQFREEILDMRFCEAESADAFLRVNLDGAVGYPTSFLEEAFGGLARKYGIERVLKRIEITSQNEPYLVQDITRYIREANTKK